MCVLVYACLWDGTRSDMLKINEQNVDVLVYKCSKDSAICIINGIKLYILKDFIVINVIRILRQGLIIQIFHI